MGNQVERGLFEGIRKSLAKSNLDTVKLETGNYGDWLFRDMNHLSVTDTV